MRYNEFKSIITEGPLSPGILRKYGPNDARMVKFIDKVNKGEPFELVDGGTVILAKPDEYDGYMAQLIDKLQNGGAPGPLMKADGTKMSFGKLQKTTELGGQTAAAGEVKAKVSNKGNVMEGVLGAATTARLMKRPGADITVNEVLNVIKKLPKTEQGGVTRFKAAADNNITDVFELTIRLDPAHYQDLTDIDLLQRDPVMPKYLQQVVNYCNSAAVVDRYATFFETNERPDVVQVVADGISDNTGTKMDITMMYIDENGKERIKHFDLSLKAGTTQQFGQAGGGSASAQPADDNFEKVSELFDSFGADISEVRNAYLKSDSLQEAYTKAFAIAAKIFDRSLSGADEDKEQKFMQRFINAIRFHGTRNDPKVKLLQFEENKFYLLDFNKLDRLYEKGAMDLKAKYQMQGNGWPVLTIYNDAKPRNNTFLSIRPKPEGSLRNLIQKGTELKRLTMVRSTKKKKKK